MKLAIIGSGPLAIFCAQHFDQLGAEVVLFQKNALGGNLRFMLDHFPEMEIDFHNTKKTLNSVWKESLVPAIENLEKNNLTKAGEVLRVHKRFLHKNEAITNHSRLHDLFRVIYSVNPKEAILKQLEENPEMFKQLGEQVVNSLHMPVESFQDFDIVIEATGRGKKALAMGPSEAYVLNENNIKATAPIFYEKEMLSNFKIEDKKNIIVVGNDESAVVALLKYKKWLFENDNHVMSWITSTSASKKFKNDWLNKELENLLAHCQALFDKEKEKFEIEIRKWRDLEDYVKVKIPMPIEPLAKLRIYQGYDVTSVDRLLDREGLFATIESPDFREIAPVNDLKTLAAEAILVGAGVNMEDTLDSGMSEDEAGYYRLDAKDLNEGVEQIKLIEQKVLAFFSRVQ